MTGFARIPSLRDTARTSPSGCRTDERASCDLQVDDKCAADPVPFFAALRKARAAHLHSTRCAADGPICSKPSLPLEECADPHSDPCVIMHLYRDTSDAGRNREGKSCA